MQLGAAIGGRYLLCGNLGEGGMGRVFKARHIHLNKSFALKVISPSLAHDVEARERFLQEAELASEVSHPNIVSVVDFGEDPSLGAYMVMEMVEGRPLLGEPLPMSIRRTCDVLAQVADALLHIHELGIVHGDVKADNIMLATEAAGGRRRLGVRLLDFGLARRAAGASPSRTISGSPHYMAPERTMGAPPSIAADIYALGVLGYLLLSGRLPFDHVGGPVEILSAHTREQPEAISIRRGEVVDPALDQLIARAFAKDPSQRHPSVSAFRYELNATMQMLGWGRRGPTRLRSDDSRGAPIMTAFERAPIAQALVSNNCSILVANAAFAQLLGYEDPREMTNRELSTTLFAVAVPSIMRAICTACTGVGTITHVARVQRRPDTELVLSVWLSPVPDAGGTLVIVHVDRETPLH